MNVHEAICEAESILKGEVAPKGELDPRWQAIIEIGAFIETEPDAVWQFIEQWGTRRDDEDLQAAVATYLLEHLLDAHFDAVIGRVQELAYANSVFAQTLSMCWWMGDAKKHERRLEKILEEAEKRKRIRINQGEESSSSKSGKAKRASGPATSPLPARPMPRRKPRGPKSR